MKLDKLFSRDDTLKPWVNKYGQIQLNVVLATGGMFNRILPAGPTRKRQAYTRVMSVEFEFIRGWISAEPTLRAVIGLIPIRLGVTITKINWWGYRRRETLAGPEERSSA